MPKQLIEIDVPDGFEVDGNARCTVSGYNDTLTAMHCDFPLRRKLSYAERRGAVLPSASLEMSVESKHQADYTITSDSYAINPKLAEKLWLGSQRGAFASTNCDVVLKVQQGDPLVDYHAPPGFPYHATRQTHICRGLRLNARWPLFDDKSAAYFQARAWYVEELGAIRPMPPAEKILTASAQPTKPEPKPIESDLSEQATRLLRHLGIEYPSTAAEANELPLIKEIHLGDGKSLRVSGKIRYKLSDDDLQELVDATMADLRRMLPGCDWQWPEWLNKEWLFLTQRGVWMAGNDEPELRYGDWWIKAFSGTWEAMSPDFVPPPCTDWRQSKRRNPNWRE